MIITQIHVFHSVNRLTFPKHLWFACSPVHSNGQFVPVLGVKKKNYGIQVNSIVFPETEEPDQYLNQPWQLPEPEVINAYTCQTYLMLFIDHWPTESTYET